MGDRPRLYRGAREVQRAREKNVRVKGRFHVTAWNYYTDEGEPAFKVNEEMEFSEYIENVSGKFRSAVLIPVNNTEAGK